MILKMLTFTGGTHEIDVVSSDETQIIKEKLEDIKGILLQQQRLIDHDNKIEDDETISCYKLKDETVVCAFSGGKFDKREI